MDCEQAISPCQVDSPSRQESSVCGEDCALPCLLPGILARRQREKRLDMKEHAIESTPRLRKGVSFAEDIGPVSPLELMKTPGSGPSRAYLDSDPGAPQLTMNGARGRPLSLTLRSPSSCASHSCRQSIVLTPNTPDPSRLEFSLRGRVRFIFFDFDGTLTRSAGSSAQRNRTQAALELNERAPMLAPRLEALRNSGIHLGILSKSTKTTITDALEEAGLSELFDGPIVGSAIGFEGKAGFIEDMIEAGTLPAVGAVEETALIDDDVRELARCRTLGIQTYAAPEEGGLQEDDFEAIFFTMGVIVEGEDTAWKGSGLDLSQQV